MRVLMSAYTCEFGPGSEPENGFNYLRAAAARHDVTVMVHERFVGHLEAQCASGHLPPVRIVAFGTPRWTSRKFGRPGIGHIDYILWQRIARRWASKHLTEFDVLHHATYGTDWMPAGLLGITSVPVVWSSVGGYAPVPWRMVKYLAPKALAAEVTREMLTRPLRLLVRRRVLRSGALVIARNADTERYFRRAGAQVILGPQVAVLPDPPPADPPSAGPGRRALFVSKLVGWKGPLVAIDTLAHLGPEWRLEFFGQGPLDNAVRARAARRGVSDRIVLHGRVPKSEVLQALRSADVLIFPSMHDSAPMPVAEAGWAGCPVVCLDVNGPPVLIAGTTGRAVSANGHADRALARAAQSVRRHPPSTRWSAAALETTVDGWYHTATGR